MNVDKIDYWVKKYGYTSIGKLVDVKSKVTPIRGASTSLIHQWFKPLPSSPCNYIIIIDSQIYKGKFGRTKNLKQRFRCYGSRGGKRVQDRIHNALFDEMLNAFNNGKNVEFYVRPAEKIPATLQRDQRRPLTGVRRTGHSRARRRSRFLLRARGHPESRR